MFIRMVGLVKSAGTRLRRDDVTADGIIVTALHRMGTAGHLIDSLFEPNPADLSCP